MEKVYGTLTIAFPREGNVTVQTITVLKLRCHSVSAQESLMSSGRQPPSVTTKLISFTVMPT